MHVFLTNGTGYVGNAIAKHLQAEGHTLVALARSEESAQKLEAQGIRVVRGAMEDLDVLAKTASEADAVIHTAFIHTFTDFGEACRVDVAATKALAGALAGTNKPLITTSATGFLGDTGPAPVNEEFPIDPEAYARIRVIGERATLAAAGEGVRSIVFRLPAFVWGNGGSTFIPAQIEAARKHGKAHYILPGGQMASGVHIDDVARAYLLALKHAPAGSIYHITSTTDSTIKSIAEAVGENVGVPVEGISFQKAIEKQIFAAWMAGIWQYNNRASSAKAQSQLHWENLKTDMLRDIAAGSYKA